MSIIGFNFTKIHVERTGSTSGKINISNNVSIKDVENAQVDLGGTKSAGLRFIFAFQSKYEPTVGTIDLTGEVIIMEDKATVDDVLKQWKDKRQVPEKLMTSVLNHVLSRCNVQALVLSRDINLPSPIPMPKVNVQNKNIDTGKEEEKKE